ncbi:hypothetical protein NDU88_002472, partial [Pleurodeles waltl]
RETDPEPETRYALRSTPGVSGEPSGVLELEHRTLPRTFCKVTRTLLPPELRGTPGTSRQQQ